VVSISLLALLFAAPQEPEGPGDSSRIEANYSGQFKEALKKATETNRLLLIKGVSVILDDQAARADYEELKDKYGK
jgi:hypothetical protein